jgi:hypothetical protein
MNPEIKIKQEYLSALSRIFSPIVIDSLAAKGYSGYLSEVCLTSGFITQIVLSKTLGEFFDWVYNILFRNYRNEYIYKNVLAQMVLQENHSPDSSQMLTEFRAGNSKADVVIINGTSTIYEIKSEYDSFARLDKQILAYLEIFDKINVITSNLQAKELKSRLPASVGILELTDNNAILTVRDSKSNKIYINKDTLFDSLRKSEYLKIIKEYYGTVPDVPNTMIYRECKILFNGISAEEAHDLSFKVLRERADSKALKYFIDNAPSSLFAYAMSISGNKKKMEALMPRFSLSMESVLTT